MFQYVNEEKKITINYIKGFSKKVYPSRVEIFLVGSRHEVFFTVLFSTPCKINVSAIQDIEHDRVDYQLKIYGGDVSVYGNFDITVMTSDSTSRWDLSVHDRSSVRAYGYGELHLHDDASAVISGHVHCSAWGNGRVEAFEKCRLDGYGAFGHAVIHDDVFCEASNVFSVEAFDNCHVIVKEGSSAVIHNKCLLMVYEAVKSVIAFDSSIVYLRDQYFHVGKVQVSGFVTVYMGGHASLKGIKRINFFGAIVSSVVKVKKDMKVYKKLHGDAIATLLIKKGQTFQSVRGSKCRTDHALVLSIVDKNGKSRSSCKSAYDWRFIYEVGKVVTAKYDKALCECSDGIHFFLEKKTAEAYPLQ